MLKLQAKGVTIWADEHHWTVHCVRSSEWSTFHLHLSEADNIYKNPPPNVISSIFFAIFISLWGSTHDSSDCWSAHRSSAARDSFKRVHDWCKAAWRRPDGPPKQKSWLRRWPDRLVDHEPIIKPIIKGSFYIVQYPVCWTAQSALHFLPSLWQTCSFRHQLGFSGKHFSCVSVIMLWLIAGEFNSYLKLSNPTLHGIYQGITFEKARRATNRSLKMTIWSLGSDLCYEGKISTRGRHYNTIRQGACFFSNRSVKQREDILTNKLAANTHVIVRKTQIPQCAWNSIRWWAIMF